MFNKRFRHAIGIDINDTAIHIVVLAKAQKNTYLTDLYHISLPNQAIVAKKIISPASIVACLKQSLNFKKSLLTVAAIADHLAIQQTIALNTSIHTNDIETELLLSTSETLPLPLSNYCFDYQLKSSTQDKQFYSFAAAPANLVLEYQNIFSSAKLPLSIIDIESSAIIYASPYLLNNYQLSGDAIVIIDTNRFIAILMAANQIVTIYSDDYDEINRKCFSWLNENRNQIKNLFLAGNIDHLSEFANSTAENLTLNIQLINPFSLIKINYPKLKSTINSKPSKWFLACALAIRGLEYE
jgi:Tfp pilus assembly PilM family ATPase